MQVSTAGSTRIKTKGFGMISLDSFPVIYLWRLILRRYVRNCVQLAWVENLFLSLQHNHFFVLFEDIDHTLIENHV